MIITDHKKTNIHIKIEIEKKIPHRFVDERRRLNWIEKILKILMKWNFLYLYNISYCFVYILFNELTFQFFSLIGQLYILVLSYNITNSKILICEFVIYRKATISDLYIYSLIFSYYICRHVEFFELSYLLFRNMKIFFYRFQFYSIYLFVFATKLGKIEIHLTIIDFLN